MEIESHFCHQSGAASKSFEDPCPIRCVLFQSLQNAYFERAFHVAVGSKVFLGRCETEV